MNDGHLHYRILTPRVVDMFPFSFRMQPMKDMSCFVHTYMINTVIINQRLDTKLCVPLTAAELPVKDHSRHKH